MTSAELRTIRNSTMAGGQKLRMLIDSLQRRSELLEEDADDLSLKLDDLGDL